MSEGEARRRDRRLGWWTVLILAVPVVAVLALATLLVLDALTLRSAASEVKAAATSVQRDLRERDVTALEGDAAALTAAADRYAAATDGPHWWVATHLMVVRDQAVPLVAVGEAVATLADGAVTPLAQAGDLSALAAPEFTDGRVDPLVLEPYRETLGQAVGAVDAAQAMLAEVDVSRTVALVRDPFEELESSLVTVGETLEAAHVTAELLPGMLGADGPRTYLVMVQNNAEPRATGGIAGAVLEVRVDDGRPALVSYRTANEMITPEGVAPLTPQEQDLFGARMAIYPQNVNFTPEMPRAAELMAAFWRQTQGAEVDGVIAIDPVALGWMLTGAPDLEVDGVRLTAGNAAETLLNTAYVRFPDAPAQDAFFAHAAAELFTALLAGGASPVEGIARAAEEGRFLVWSADASEQSLLAGTPVGGAFLERDHALGVFVNDGSGSKIGWYVDTAVTVTDLVCPDGRVLGERIDVAMTHAFDGDVAALPATVRGGLFVPEGRFEANVMVIPPTGTLLAGVTRDGETVGIGQGALEDRAVGQVRVTLDPGQSVAYSFDLTAGAPRDAAPDLVVTPGPREADVERRQEVATGC